MSWWSRKNVLIDSENCGFSALFVRELNYQCVFCQLVRYKTWYAAWHQRDEETDCPYELRKQELALSFKWVMIYFRLVRRSAVEIDLKINFISSCFINCLFEMYLLPFTLNGFEITLHRADRNTMYAYWMLLIDLLKQTELEIFIYFCKPEKFTIRQII